MAATSVRSPCEARRELSAGKHAVLRRNLGDKAVKMVYSPPESCERVRTVLVPEADRARFCLTDEDLTSLARRALLIEEHYRQPMDVECGKDGVTGEIFILQARPETERSRAGGTIQRFSLKSRSQALNTGRSIGRRSGSGPARVIRDVGEMPRVQAGDVLVADMTNPDWELVLKRASASVTNRDDRSCHAAIIARELGIPAVVGSGDATRRIREGQEVTVSCAEGDTGDISAGLLEYEHLDDDLKAKTVAQMTSYADPVSFYVEELAKDIAACRRRDKYIGICGHGPSDYPNLARWLVDQGIESMSLNSDAVVEPRPFLAEESG